MTSQCLTLEDAVLLPADAAIGNEWERVDVTGQGHSLVLNHAQRVVRSETQHRRVCNDTYKHSVTRATILDIGGS